MFEKKNTVVVSVLVDGREQRVVGKLAGSYECGKHYEFEVGKKKQTVEVVSEYPLVVNGEGKRIIGAVLGNTTAVPMYGEAYKGDPGDAVMAIHETQIAVKVVKAISGKEGLPLWFKLAMVGAVVLIAYYLYSRFTGGSEVQTEQYSMMIMGWF